MSDFGVAQQKEILHPVGSVDVKLTTNYHLLSTLRMSGAIPQLLPYAIMVWTGTRLLLPLLLLLLLQLFIGKVQISWTVCEFSAFAAVQPKITSFWHVTRGHLAVGFRLFETSGFKASITYYARHFEP